MAAREFKTVIGKKIKTPTEEVGGDSCLVVIAGTNLGKVYPIKEDETLIGRSDDCDIECDDPLTSRQHAHLLHGDNSVTVTDLESTNGTFVNFKRIDKTILHNGDKLSIGQTIFKYLDSDTIETTYHDELYNLAAMDGLTQIFNRKKFGELLDKAITGARKGDDKLCMFMMDIDFFKKINDTFGHQAGDYALRTVSALIKQVIRREDIFARYGGEEFCLLLVNQTLEQSRMVAEKIRHTIETFGFNFEGHDFSLTLSIGIANFNAAMDNADQLIKIADGKLYEAKESGRNRVCC